MSDLLRSLKTNKWLWANRSGCSEEMSDRKQFAQVAQRKWAMWANHSFRSPKMSEWALRSKYFGLKNLKSCFTLFYLRFKKKNSTKMSESLIFAHFLFFGEQREWIAHFAQIKWAMWVNRSFRSPNMSHHERFAQVAQRKWAMWANEWIAHFFEQIAHSLIFGQNRAIRSEIKWANSQPWAVQINNLRHDEWVPYS